MINLVVKVRHNNCRRVFGRQLTAANKNVYTRIRAAIDLK